FVPLVQKLVANEADKLRLFAELLDRLGNKTSDRKIRILDEWLVKQDTIRKVRINFSGKDLLFHVRRLAFDLFFKYRCGKSACLGRDVFFFKKLWLHRRNMHSNIIGKLLELLVFADEVSLAGKLDHHAGCPCRMNVCLNSSRRKGAV